jgi:hypothetical protein
MPYVSSETRTIGSIFVETTNSHQNLTNILTKFYKNLSHYNMMYAFFCSKIIKQVKPQDIASHSLNIVSKNQIFVMKTNLMHYLALIYFIKQPLHGSGLFIAHHQEVFTVYVQ